MTDDAEHMSPQGPRCWETHEFMGATHTCVRPLDHDGQHGSGPFIEYSLMWGEELLEK